MSRTARSGGLSKRLRLPSPPDGGRAPKRLAQRVRDHAIVYALGLGILLPFIWIFLSAFKSPVDLAQYPPSILPDRWTLENFTGFFKATQFQRAMLNSAWLAFLTTVVAMAVSTPGAYVLARFDSPIFQWIGRFFIFSYMMPAILLIVPIYKIFGVLGLTNSLWGLVPIYTALVMPLTLWTLRSFFASMPRELEEAALVDGCTPFTAFLKIAVPQAVPGLIATGIIAMSVGWSEYLFASTLLTTPDQMTISPRLESFMGRGIFNWGWLMAGGLAVTLPIIVVSALVQRRLVEGWSAGALKG